MASNHPQNSARPTTRAIAQQPITVWLNTATVLPQTSQVATVQTPVSQGQTVNP